MFELVGERRDDGGRRVGRPAARAPALPRRPPRRRAPRRRPWRRLDSYSWACDFRPPGLLSRLQWTSRALCATSVGPRKNRRRQSVRRAFAAASAAPSRLPPSLDVDALLERRDADGRRGDRLAGVLDPPQRLRPGPDRPRRVRCRFRCSPCPPGSWPTACPGWRSSSSGASPTRRSSACSSSSRSAARTSSGRSSRSRSRPARRPPSGTRPGARSSRSSCPRSS